MLNSFLSVLVNNKGSVLNTGVPMGSSQKYEGKPEKGVSSYREFHAFSSGNLTDNQAVALYAGMAAAGKTAGLSIRPGAPFTYIAGLCGKRQGIKAAVCKPTADQPRKLFMCRSGSEGPGKIQDVRRLRGAGKKECLFIRQHPFPALLKASDGGRTGPGRIIPFAFLPADDTDPLTGDQPSGIEEPVFIDRDPCQKPFKL